MRLFEPGTIGTMKVKNRIVMAPMHTGGMVETDGRWGERVYEYYVARARGGAGLIITGYFFASRKLEPASLRYFDLYSDNHLESLRRTIEAIHGYGTKVCVQLTAGWGRVVSKRRQDPEIAPVAPSPLRCYFTPERMTRSLTTEEVQELAQSFGKAAVRCKMAGADAVELHGHEGYLLDQFMTELWNHRTDRYGGSREKRLSFVREIVTAIKDGVGNGFQVIYRFGINHYLKGGRTSGESVWIARELENMGVDALHVDAGCYDNHYWPHPPGYHPPGCMIDMAEQVKPAVKIPVIAVGRLHYPAIAEKVLQQGKADFIALGRGLLADPDWANKVRNGNLEDIRSCIGDGEGCTGELIQGRAPSCTLNPACGHEKEWSLVKSKSDKSLLVVGGGPAGMEASQIAAQRGIHVTLWEKSDKLGGKLWPASVPEFKKDLRGLIEYQVLQLRKQSVEIVLHKEAAPEDVLRFGADYVILATGAMPVLPEIPGINDNRVLTALDLTSNRSQIGERVVVVGGGLIGSETAVYLRQNGHQVTLIEALPGILDDILDINREMLLKMIADNHVAVLTNTRILKVIAEGIMVKQNGQDGILRADNIVICVGMRSCNELQKSLTNRVENVFAIGDCVEPRYITQAIWEAFHASRKLEV